MSEYWNPFDTSRPELSIDPIIEYFVAPDFLPHLIESKKPMVIVGGRGTGKTTLLRYLSYEGQRLLHGDDFLEKSNHIGVYWKSYTFYVSAFEGSGLEENEWTRVFAHYLNVSFCKLICEVIIDIKKFAQYEFESNISNSVAEIFSCQKKINSYEELLDFLKLKQQEIETYVNNIGRVSPPIISLAGKGYSTFCKELMNEKAFSGKWFYFLIDEYETLSLYQQKVVNSFIKHAEVPFTFKICRRVYGDKTDQTLSETEVLQDPADWTIWDLNNELDKEFSVFVKDICKKRLEKHPTLKAENKTDIEYFLESLSVREECRLLDEKRPDFIQIQFRLEEILKNDKTMSEEMKHEILSVVTSHDDLLIKRLFLCLIERDSNSITDVYYELLKYLRGEPSNFTQGKEWLHNNALGVLFLLCNEYKIKKIYCGFEVYKLLSSGNIRYFLDLCSATFRFAMREGYSLEKPFPIHYDIQNKAVRYVAQKKLQEVSKNQPYGDLLKEFSLALGKIFEHYHKDPKQSEPEKNQFTSDLSALGDESREVIKRAVMNDILLEFPSTKAKNKNEIKTSDYMLHPIFSPYFNIVYTKGRKISIKPHQLSQLIVGSRKDKENVVRVITKAYQPQKGDFIQQTLFDFMRSDGSD